MSDKTPEPKSLAARFIKSVDQRWTSIITGLFLFTLAIVTFDFITMGARQINWIYFTGYLPGMYLLIRSSELPGRIKALRHSLIRQGIMEVCERTDGELIPLEHSSVLSHLEDSMEEEVFERTSKATVILMVIGIVIVLCFGIHRPLDGQTDSLTQWLHWAEYMLGLSYVVLLCLRFGRALGFSLVMWTYRSVVLEKDGKTYGMHPRPQAGHADGHYGFKIVNEFWSYEASLMIPLLIYTLGWLAALGANGVAPVLPAFYDTYPNHNPLEVFFWLSGCLLALQVMALWLPVIALRVIMGRAMEEAQKKADIVALNVHTLKQRLLNESTPSSEKEEIASELAYALDAYHDHENVSLWPISGRTLGNHLLHLWGLAVFLGIVTTENIMSDFRGWLVVGTPVTISFSNHSKHPVSLRYLGPSQCWYQGSIPDDPIELKAGGNSGPFESEVLPRRCEDKGIEPFFSVWLNREESPLGPVSIGGYSVGECDEPNMGNCLRLLSKPADVNIDIARDPEGTGWQLSVND